MRAGQKRTRLEIQAQTEILDDYGDVDPDSNWSTVVDGEVWGHVKPMSGRELFEARQVVDDVTHQVTIWHWPGLTPKHRFKRAHSDSVLEIGSVIDPDERHAEMVCMCTERT